MASRGVKMNRGHRRGETSQRVRRGGEAHDFNSSLTRRPRQMSAGRSARPGSERSRLVAPAYPDLAGDTWPSSFIVQQTRSRLPLCAFQSARPAANLPDSSESPVPANSVHSVDSPVSMRGIWVRRHCPVAAESCQPVEGCHEPARGKLRSMRQAKASQWRAPISRHTRRQV